MMKTKRQKKTGTALLVSTGFNGLVWLGTNKTYGGVPSSQKVILINRYRVRW